MIAVASIILHALIFCLLAGGLFGVLGVALRRLFGLHTSSLEDLTIDAWVGWGVVVGVLQIWHLWLPVDNRAVVALFVLGLVVGGAVWRDLWGLMNAGRRSHPGALLLLGLFALWVASQTTTRAALCDTGLYHQPAIRWIRAFPIVPGLGNLNDWLAFNNSYFLYAAWMDFGWFSGKCHQVANGALVMLAAARIVAGLSRLFARAGHPRMYHVFDAFFLIPVLWHVEGAYDFASSPTPDLPVFLIQMVVISEGIRLLDDARRAVKPANSGVVLAGPSGRQTAYRVFQMVFLCGVGVTVKLSFAAVAVSASLLALICLWMNRSRNHLGKPISWIALGSAAIIAPWLARGLLTSGYPAYPLTGGAAPVEWRMPLERVAAHERLIRAWGRKFGSVPFAEVAAGSTRVADKVLARPWFWNWLNQALRQPFETVVPLALAFVVAPALWMLRGPRTGRVSWGTLRMAGATLWIPLMGLVYWFVTVPSLRFAGALFWALAAGMLALAISDCEPFFIRSVWLMASALIFAMSINLMGFLVEYDRDTGPIPSALVTTRLTDSGLAVLVPQEGDECRNAPLPCMPYFQPRLRLRVPGELASGFVTDPPAVSSH